MFDIIDNDNTGFVSRSEMRNILGDENISQFMKSADENGDDELSAKEWQAHLDRRKAEVDPTFRLHFQKLEALQSRAHQKGGKKDSINLMLIHTK